MFSRVLVNRGSKSPERELGRPRPIPALQWQQKATVMTRWPTPPLSNQHVLGPNRHRAPWQRLNSISQLFEDPQAVMETRKEEELPYEEGSCGRGTCWDPGWSHHALGGCRAAGSRGVGVVLPWADLNTGNISATFWCCFWCCLVKVKTYVGLVHFNTWPWQAKISCSTSKECLCKGEGEGQWQVRSDTGGQLYHSRFSNRESKNHEGSRGAEKHREPLWEVMHS